jgi:signal transduction histidine kinase
MTLDQATSERLESAVDDLDTTVREIRSAIFELHSTRAPETSFRVAATGLVAEAARTLGFEPSISFEGPLDRAVEGALADHLLSVEREALANVARHANASAAEVRFALADGWVALSITDNGSGPGDVDSGGHGLRNMRSRAERLGGRFDIAGTEGGGTSVAWSVPVPT